MIHNISKPTLVKKTHGHFLNSISLLEDQNFTQMQVVKAYDIFFVLFTDINICKMKKIIYYAEFKKNRIVFL